MSATKWFLLKTMLVYSILAALGLYMFRSPNLSEAYLSTHEAAHERYVKITNNPEFQIFSERPNLYPADDPRQEQLAFVEAYRAQPDYQAERIRIELFTLYFHFLNGVTFLVVVFRFGYRPAVNYIDKRASQMREDLESAAQARTVTMHELAEVETEADAWPQKEHELQERAEEAIESSLVQIREEARLARIQLARETEDRKGAEVYSAAGQIKEEMVSEAIGTLEKRYVTEATERELRQNVEHFVRLLELIS